MNWRDLMRDDHSAVGVKPFSGSFTQQEPIPDAGIAAAVALMKSGRLHRYNVKGNDIGATAKLEAAYAKYQGSLYCLAIASGGAAMSISLRAAGVKPGDPVLTNAFTLAPVPGAIAAVGARPVLVEVTEDLVLDLEDLTAKIITSGAKVLMLSHMRGHICDMDVLTELLTAHRVTLIEDCAHTMGAKWNGTRSGNFGLAGCFSTQTYKHMNSGEGGFLTSDDPEFMARAIIMSGSYMLYERHGAAPDAAVFEKVRLVSPNISSRMDNLRAELLLSQLLKLDDNCERWNARYRRLAEGLRDVPNLVLPHRPQAEAYVASSIQFRVPGLGPKGAERVLAGCAALGVELKWFGEKTPRGFTSSHHSWQYAEAQKLPQTDAIMADLFDMRIPLTFSLTDCDQITGIIRAVLKGELS